MRFSLAAALLAATALSACADMQGNPNGSPYATEPGGTIAVKPEVLGMVSYDPYATPAPFVDMQMGRPATNPAPATPLNLKPIR
ncbi:MAG: hypothetical protein H0U98_06250 [Alphaproteobacteria bacterium]|nr:hypothetical protein [Alphaproteobacteria bacterium]